MKRRQEPTEAPTTHPNSEVSAAVAWAAVPRSKASVRPSTRGPRPWVNSYPLVAGGNHWK